MDDYEGFAFLFTFQQQRKNGEMGGRKGGKIDSSWAQKATVFIASFFIGWGFILGQQ